VVSLFAGVRGYLDVIPVGKVGPFERQMLAEVRSQKPEILAGIRDKKELTKDNEAALVSFLDSFAKSFS
jgi:F-type H+-transporting ATPase subunit alpha